MIPEIKKLICTYCTISLSKVLQNRVILHIEICTNYKLKQIRNILNNGRHYSIKNFNEICENYTLTHNSKTS